jgi:hypothetical protein
VQNNIDQEILHVIEGCDVLAALRRHAAHVALQKQRLLGELLFVLAKRVMLFHIPTGRSLKVACAGVRFNFEQRDGAREIGGEGDVRAVKVDLHAHGGKRRGVLLAKPLDRPDD